MRPRRPVVHHGAVALSSGSLYQARPALQSIPRLAPRKGRPSHMRIDWRIALPVLVHFARSLISPHQSAVVMAPPAAVLATAT